MLDQVAALQQLVRDYECKVDNLEDMLRDSGRRLDMIGKLLEQTDVWLSPVHTDPESYEFSSAVYGAMAVLAGKVDKPTAAPRYVDLGAQEVD